MAGHTARSDDEQIRALQAVGYELRMMAMLPSDCAKHNWLRTTLWRGTPSLNQPSCTPGH